MQVLFCCVGPVAFGTAYVWLERLVIVPKGGINDYITHLPRTELRSIISLKGLGSDFEGGEGQGPRALTLMGDCDLEGVKVRILCCAMRCDAMLCYAGLRAKFPDCFGFPSFRRIFSNFLEFSHGGRVVALAPGSAAVAATAI